MSSAERQDKPLLTLTLFSVVDILYSSPGGIAWQDTTPFIELEDPKRKKNRRPWPGDEILLLRLPFVPSTPRQTKTTL